MVIFAVSFIELPATSIKLPSLKEANPFPKKIFVPKDYSEFNSKFGLTANPIVGGKL